MARSHGGDHNREDTQAPTAHTQPDRVGAKGLSRVHPRHRTVAIGAWLGTSTWPAYCAAAITAAYGLLKAYWVFGGTALWSIAAAARLIDSSDPARPQRGSRSQMLSASCCGGRLVCPGDRAPTAMATSVAGPLVAVAARHVHGARGVLGMIGDVQQIASVIWPAHPPGHMGSGPVGAAVPDLGSAGQRPSHHPARAPTALKSTRR